MQNLKIDLAGLEQFFDNSTPEARNFLNLGSGNIVTLSLSDENIEAYLRNVRFAEIPMPDTRRIYHDMIVFIDNLTNRTLAEKLSLAIQGQGASRRFETILMRYPEVQQQWAEYKRQRLQERIAEWLAEIDVRADIVD